MGWPARYQPDRRARLAGRLGRGFVALPPAHRRPDWQDARMQTELRDVAAGLWIWRAEHPAWRPGLDWEPLVASTCVESGGETLVLDPLAPPAETSDVWE